MASGKSNFCSKEILDQLLGASAYTAPTPIWYGLTTAAITAAQTGSTVTEVSGGSYARVSQTNNLTNWPAATGTLSATKSNATAVTFPTATGSWGTVTDMFIADASTGGNILYFGALTTSKAITTDDVAKFAIGDITVNEGYTA